MSRALLTTTLAWTVGLQGLAAAATAPPAEGPLFSEEAAASGLDFVHFNGMSDGRYLLEVTGAGGALLDYDNDGDLDAYLLQGHMLGPGKTLEDARFPPPAGTELIDRLYRNDSAVAADGTVTLRFVDVTDAAGIRAPAYGMGAAAADYDNDGDVDLYVTNFGPNQLWRNNGDGTFRDVTEESGTGDVRWSVPASFLDFDGDGLLDLFVGNYVKFTFALERSCSSQTGEEDYCGPLAFSPEGDRLFRNRGDGRFEDWTRRTGIESEFGGALGVVAADFNADRKTDLYVANDMTPNQLWINLGDGSFRNDALFAGCAVNWEGKPEASMGVDAADFDGDGDEDLFMAHLTGETNTLYLNDGTGIFRDQTQVSGLGSTSWSSTGFGAGWVDYDNDGRLDLLTANGAVKVIEALRLAGDPLPLHQPNQLFRNLGGGKFEDVTSRAGPAFELSEVSRGAAFGDVDNDGDPDTLITNNSGPVRLLRNQVGNTRGWIGLRLVGGAPPRDQLGARVAVTASGDGQELWRRVRADGSFASANDPRVLVGLGDAERVGAVRALWPDGTASSWTELPTGVYLTLYRRPEAP